MVVFKINLYYCIVVDAYIMPEDTQIYSLQSELNIDNDTKTTCQYTEPKNDIFKCCLNKIDNAAQQRLKN